MIDLPPPTYQQTIESIAKCDIPRTNIRIRYENYLQSDEITISDLGSVGDGKLLCLRAAVHPSYILTIANQKQQAAFYEFSRRADRPGEKAEALAWVRTKGLIARLPAFDPQQRLDAFGSALETACGLKAGSALAVAGRSLIVRPDFIRGHNVKTLAAPLECLMKMYAASDAAEHGVDLGFIGNEAYANENKK